MTLTPESPLRPRRGEMVKPKGEATSRITAHVRALRQSSTQAEEILWDALRNKKTGYKFVRQKPFAVQYYGKRHTFIVDFYCRECKVVVEVDGAVHDNQQEYDTLRTKLLEQQHALHVIRFTNKVVIDALERVVNDIKSTLFSFSPLRERRGVGGEAV